MGMNQFVRACDYKYAGNERARYSLSPPLCVRTGKRGCMKAAVKAREFFRAAIFAVVCFSFVVNVAPAQKPDSKKIAEAAKDAQKAADAFTEIMNVADKAIPQKLLDRA